MLGVNEAVFPAVPAEPAILTDADRDELGQHAGAPGPDLRERLARERFLGYIACTRASKKLVVTFSRHDAEGRALNPSPFIAHLRRIVPRLDIEESSSEVKLDEAEHVSEIASSLMAVRSSEPEAGAPSHETVKNWDELLALPALAGWLDYLRALREPDPAESLSSALAEKLFGPTLRSSVSRLEEFAQCPFRFFVHSGLRAEERKVFELDAREQGSFQHEVLKRFHEQLTPSANAGGTSRRRTPARAWAELRTISRRITATVCCTAASKAGLLRGCWRNRCRISLKRW